MKWLGLIAMLPMIIGWIILNRKAPKVADVINWCLFMLVAFILMVWGLNQWL